MNITIDEKSVICFTVIQTPVDCAWSDFGEWTQCSAECGTGTQTRTRTEETAAENGGAACDGDSTETQDCNTHACSGT